jgi:hypothetical protein
MPIGLHLCNQLIVKELLTNQTLIRIRKATLLVTGERRFGNDLHGQNNQDARHSSAAEAVNRVGVDNKPEIRRCGNRRNGNGNLIFHMIHRDYPSCELFRSNPFSYRKTRLLSPTKKIDIKDLG